MGPYGSIVIVVTNLIDNEVKYFYPNCIVEMIKYICIFCFKMILRAVVPEKKRTSL